MQEEFKDVRRKLEESLREMEILKRKALRLEDENEHLVRITINNTHYLKTQPPPHNGHLFRDAKYFRPGWEICSYFNLPTMDDQ